MHRVLRFAGQHTSKTQCCQWYSNSTKQRHNPATLEPLHGEHSVRLASVKIGIWDLYSSFPVITITLYATAMEDFSTPRIQSEMLNEICIEYTHFQDIGFLDQKTRAHRGIHISQATVLHEWFHSDLPFWGAYRCADEIETVLQTIGLNLKKF